MATDKKVFAATGNPVFTRIGKGLYVAEMFGYDLELERIQYDTWVCRMHKCGELVKEYSGSTRSEATRRAYYDVLNHEKERLDWIITEQPYRSYGGHKPRSSKKSKEVDSQYVTGVVHIQTLGGWCWYIKDSESKAIIKQGGPFEKEKDAQKDLDKAIKEL